MDKAVAWWKAKRPIGWSLERHLENPVVNCITDIENALARKVAVVVNFRMSQKRGSDGRR